MIVWLILLIKLSIVVGQLNDICVKRVNDGHSNDIDTITQEHCAMYDRTMNGNVDTMQILDLDGSIAGCWVHETTGSETYYYNTNLNPSGMCSSPHFCVQYADCSAIDSVAIFVAPTDAPTATLAPTDTEYEYEGGDGIGGVSLTTDPPTHSEPTTPTKDIIMIAAIVLVFLTTVFGYFVARSHQRTNISYR